LEIQDNADESKPKVIKNEQSTDQKGGIFPSRREARLSPFVNREEGTQELSEIDNEGQKKDVSKEEALDPFGIRAMFKEMNLHTLSSEIRQVKTTLGESKNDVRILQDWCQESFDDLEARTAAGFENCGEMIEKVEEGIDKVKEEQKGQRKELQKHAEDLKALKEALEELKGSGRGEDRAPASRSTNGAPAA
jgi:archaellum component FlaC